MISASSPHKPHRTTVIVAHQTYPTMDGIKDFPIDNWSKHCIARLEMKLTFCIVRKYSASNLISFYSYRLTEDLAYQQGAISRYDQICGAGYSLHANNL